MYEYDSVVVGNNRNEITKILNQVGKKSWEAFHMEDAEMGMKIIYMKRKV